eukprot:4824762-Karenia_brevis.AAC.1
MSTLVLRDLHFIEEDVARVHREFSALAATGVAIVLVTALCLNGVKDAGEQTGNTFLVAWIEA